MDRIVVAFETEKQRSAITSALTGAGEAVRRVCVSRAETVRAINEMGGGIVVCGYKLPDATADELAYDLGMSAVVLVVAGSDMLSDCENPDLFKLAAPFSRGELVSAVRMLKQLEQMRLPRRSAGEKAVIGEAKRRLMDGGMSEPEAHRALQKMSMATGERMTDAARRILEEN